MGTHSSILAWRTLWTEEPGRLQSQGRKESDKTKHSIDIERDYYIELGHEIVKDDKSFAEWSERLDTQESQQAEVPA